MFDNWFLILTFSFLIGLICLFLINLINKKKNKIKNIKRLGGVAFVIPFFILVFLSGIEITIPIITMLLGSLAILIFGIWDDFKNLTWKTQIIFQIALIFLVVLLGNKVDYISLFRNNLIYLDGWQIFINGISFSIFSAFFIFIWYLLIINSINWSDGIDGLLSVISLVALASILIVSLRPEVNQPAVAIICLIMVGSLLSFIWFNFPPAKIIAGTSGSYFLGFILATLAIMAGTKIATLLIVLALPIVDAVWVIINRWKNKKSIFAKDKNQRHFHYQLRKLGWNDQKILLSYFIFLFIIFLLTFFLENRFYKLWILIIEVGLIIFCIGVVNWKVRKTRKQKILNKK